MPSKKGKKKVIKKIVNGLEETIASSFRSKLGITESSEYGSEWTPRFSQADESNFSEQKEDDEDLN